MADMIDGGKRARPGRHTSDEIRNLVGVDDVDISFSDDLPDGVKHPRKRSQVSALDRRVPGDPGPSNVKIDNIEIGAGEHRATIVRIRDYKERVKAGRFHSTYRSQQSVGSATLLRYERGKKQNLPRAERMRGQVVHEYLICKNPIRGRNYVFDVVVSEFRTQRQRDRSASDPLGVRVVARLKFESFPVIIVQMEW